MLSPKLVGQSESRLRIFSRRNTWKSSPGCIRSTSRYSYLISIPIFLLALRRNSSRLHTVLVPCAKEWTFSNEVEGRPPAHVPAASPAGHACSSLANNSVSPPPLSDSGYRTNYCILRTSSTSKASLDSSVTVRVNSKACRGKRRQVEHFLKTGYVEILSQLCIEHNLIFILDPNSSSLCGTPFERMEAMEDINRAIEAVGMAVDITLLVTCPPAFFIWKAYPVMSMVRLHFG